MSMQEAGAPGMMPSILFTELSLKIICVEIFWLFSLSFFFFPSRFPPPILLAFFQPVFTARRPWGTSPLQPAKRQGAPEGLGPSLCPRPGESREGLLRQCPHHFFVAVGREVKAAIVQGLLLTLPFPSEKQLS